MGSAIGGRRTGYLGKGVARGDGREGERVERMAEGLAELCDAICGCEGAV